MYVHSVEDVERSFTDYETSFHHCTVASFLVSFFLETGEVAAADSEGLVVAPGESLRHSHSFPGSLEEFALASARVCCEWCSNRHWL